MATRDQADESAGSSSTAAETPAVAWAPVESAAKKRRLGLWIGIPAGLAVVGLVAGSLVLIAPGTAVAGAPVGFQTAGSATDSIQNRLAETTITFGEGGPTLTGAELGASVDASALAAQAYDERPMWNVSQWFGDPVTADVSIDAEVATAALRAASPGLFTDPVAATIAFDGKAYVATPAEAGVGVDILAIQSALNDAFAAGETSLTLTPTASVIESTTTTANAEGTASALNAMLAKVGFYVGDERVVPIAAATAVEWLTVEADDSGQFTIAADAAKIQPFVDALGDKVDQEPVNGSVIVNSAGKVLATPVAGQDGRVLGDTDGVANAFADQLASGDPAYQLPVEVTPHSMAESVRLLEVDLSEQRLYVKENGAVTDSWAISSGLDISPTIQGRYAINWHVRSQTMTASDPDNPYWNYEVENVEWVMYFNGDQAFHGIYWHNNFGNQMSHGCVGMPNYRAQQIYNWAPDGVEVWIHA
nr:MULTISPECIES: L,D-transpeptidase [Microbacterium]